MATTAAILDILIRADTGKATASLRKMDSTLGRTATSGARATKTSDKLHSSTRRLGSSLASAAKWAGGGAAAYISISQAKAAVTTTQDLTKATLGLQKNLGLSGKEAGEWAAAARSRGVDTNKLGMAFKTLSTQVESARGGSDTAQKSFKALGIDFGDLEKGSKNVGWLMRQVADGVHELGGGTERTAAASKLFGRGWQALSPMIRDGSKALNENLQLTEKYGAALHGKTLKQQEDLMVSLRESKLAWMGLQVSFTTAVTPALKVLNKQFQHISAIMADPKLTASEKWTKVSRIIERDLSKAFDVFMKILPRIASQVGEHAPKIAKALIDGFLQANVWGKLALGAWFFTKIGLTKAIIKKVAARLGAEFGLVFAAESAAGTTAASAAAGGAGGKKGMAGMIGKAGLAASGGALVAAAQTGMLPGGGLGEAAGTIGGGALAGSAFGPWGALVGAALGATVEIIKHWDSVKQALANVWEWIKDHWKIFAVIFAPIAPIITITILIIKHWKALKGALGAVWGWLKGAASTIFGLVGQAARMGLLGPIPLIISRWGQVKAALGAVWGFLKDAVRTLGKVVLWAAQHGLLGPVALIISRWKTVKTVLGGIWDWIKGAAKNTFGAVAGFASSLAGKVTSAIRGGLNMVVGFINDIIGVLNKIPFVEIGKVGAIGGGRGGIGGTGVKSGHHSKTAGKHAGGGAHRQRGGIMVPGQGTGDKVPALLEPGEVVWNRKAVAVMGGAQKANAVNKAIPRFQLGGIGHAIGSAASGAASLPGKALGAAGDVVGAGAGYFIDKLPQPNLPSWLDPLGEGLAKGAIAYIKDKVNIFGGGGSGGGSTAGLAKLWHSVNPHVGDSHLMGAIAMAESGGDPHAHGPPDGRGLWQIEWPVWGPTLGKFGSPYAAGPNARMAREVLKSQGLGAWVAYNNGNYRQFMQRGGIVRLQGGGFIPSAAEDSLSKAKTQHLANLGWDYREGNRGMGWYKPPHGDTFDPGRMGGSSTSAAAGVAGQGRGPRTLGKLISIANAVNRKHFPYVLGGGHEQPANLEPFDCSGAVSYLLQQSGFPIATNVAAGFKSAFSAGPGKDFTIYASDPHVFVGIGDKQWGTSHANPGGGAGWFSGNSTAGFTARHPELAQAAATGSAAAGKAPKLTKKEKRLAAHKKRVDAIQKAAKNAAKLDAGPFQTRIDKQMGLAAQFEEYAGYASSIGTDDAMGSFKGQTEDVWLLKQLDHLINVRNTLVALYQVWKAVREKLAREIENRKKLIDKLQAKLKKSGDAKPIPSKREDSLPKKTTDRLAQAGWDYHDGHWWPPKTAGLGKRILDEQKANAGARVTLADLVTKIGTDTPDGEGVLGQLATLQGSEMPKAFMTTVGLGQLGGTILDVQLALRELGAKTTGTDSERANLLAQLLKEANQRTAVSQAQYPLADWARAIFGEALPFGGSFKTGGVVPGPVGAPMMIEAHGGETVSPVGASSDIRVEVHDHRIRVFHNEKEIEAVVKKVTRGQARGVGRTPGSAGSLTG